MDNLYLKGLTVTEIVAGETVGGTPLIISAAMAGVPMTSSDDVSAYVDAPANLAATLAGSGGYWPDGSYVLYAVAALFGDGIESLPAVLAAGPMAASDDIQLDWDAVAGATGYRIYRGISALTAAGIGMDVIQVAETTTAIILDDDGYELTARAAAAVFEEVVPKGSSTRPANVRQTKERLAQGSCVPIVKRGVVELPISPITAEGVDAVVHGAPCYWDATNGWLQVTITGSAILCGVFNLSYLPTQPNLSRVGMEFNVT